MQENDSIEREAKMPGSFYLSPTWIKNFKTRLIIGLLFWVLVTIYIIATGFNIGHFLQGLCVAITMIAGFERLEQFQYLVKNNQPAITVEEKFIRYVKIGYKQEGVRILFNDIVFAEVKENYFGSKRLSIIYNKEITYKIKKPFYEKMMFSFERSATSWSGSWSLRGLSVEPEVLAQSINYHLEQHQAEAELIRNQEIYPPYNTY